MMHRELALIQSKLVVAGSKLTHVSVCVNVALNCFMLSIVTLISFACVLMVPPITDVFFSILFGSDQVEPYIGELGLASSFDAFLKLAEMGDGSMSFESWDDMKSVLGWGETALKRRKRETEIAMNLRDRISDYVDGYLAEDAFKVSCWNEAVSISKGGSYGASFLSAIGPAVSIDLGAVVFVPTMPSTC